MGGSRYFTGLDTGYIYTWPPKSTFGRLQREGRRNIPQTVEHKCNPVQKQPGAITSNQLGEATQTNAVAVTNALPESWGCSALARGAVM